MSIGGDIIPRPDLSPEQCKTLAEVILEWSRNFEPVKFLDYDAVNDLQEGELPKPWALRFAASCREPVFRLPEEYEQTATLEDIQRLARDPNNWEYPDGVDLETIKRAFPDEARERTIPFSLSGGARYSREEATESLRRFISSELVQDIEIDGRSWTEEV